MQTYTDIFLRLEEIEVNIDNAYVAHQKYAWSHVEKARKELVSLKEEVKLNIKQPKTDTLEKLGQERLGL